MIWKPREPHVVFLSRNNPVQENNDGLCMALYRYDMHNSAQSSKLLLPRQQVVIDTKTL